MRKLIYLMNLSLDGFIEGPDGKFDWSMPDEEVHRFHNRQAAEMGGFLYGRRMYEIMQYWQTADQDADANEVTVEFARIWQQKPKYVFSTTLSEVGENCSLVRGDAALAVSKLKMMPGGNLGVGGADLASSLARHGLIDEYHLVISPVLVGGGRTYFPHHNQIEPLRLIETQTFNSGTLYLRYASAEAGKA